MRLKSKLLSLNADKRDSDKVKVFSPKNCEELRIPFQADKIAKVVGKLAQLPPPLKIAVGGEEARLITGVLVQNDFKMSLMAPEDLREFAGLTTTTITCKQRLTLSAAGIGLVKWALESTFGAIEEIFEDDGQTAKMNGKAITNGDDSLHEGSNDKHTVSYMVMGCVIVRYGNRGDVEVEWEGNMINDGIADAVLAVLFAAESSPAAVKRKCPHMSLIMQGQLRAKPSKSRIIQILPLPLSFSQWRLSSKPTRGHFPLRTARKAVHVPGSAIRERHLSDRASTDVVRRCIIISDNKWHRHQHIPRGRIRTRREER